MWENLIISAMLGILRTVVKNPQRAAELKSYLLTIRDDINLLYPGE